MSPLDATNASFIMGFIVLVSSRRDTHHNTVRGVTFLSHAWSIRPITTHWIAGQSEHASQNDELCKNWSSFRKAEQRGATIMYSMWKIMCFLNLEPRKHIALQQITPNNVLFSNIIWPRLNWLKYSNNTSLLSASECLYALFLPWSGVFCWRGGVRAAGSDGGCLSRVSPGSVRLRRASAGCQTRPEACSSSAGRVCWEGHGSPAGFGAPGSGRCGAESCGQLLYETFNWYTHISELLLDTGINHSCLFDSPSI